MSFGAMDRNDIAGRCDFRSREALLEFLRQEHGGTFTSRAYQKLVGVDIYTASRDIKDLIRKGVARLSQKGGRVYRIAESFVSPPPPIPEEFIKIEPLLQQKGFVQNKDVREVLGVSRLQAWRILQNLVALGWLRLEQKGRNARYVRQKMHHSHQ